MPERSAARSSPSGDARRSRGESRVLVSRPASLRGAEGREARVRKPRRMRSRPRRRQGRGRRCCPRSHVARRRLAGDEAPPGSELAVVAAGSTVKCAARRVPCSMDSRRGRRRRAHADDLPRRTRRASASRKRRPLGPPRSSGRICGRDTAPRPRRLGRADPTPSDLPCLPLLRGDGDDLAARGGVLALLELSHWSSDRPRCLSMSCPRSPHPRGRRGGRASTLRVIRLRTPASLPGALPSRPSRGGSRCPSSTGRFCTQPPSLRSPAPCAAASLGPSLPSPAPSPTLHGDGPRLHHGPAPRLLSGLGIGVVTWRTWCSALTSWPRLRARPGERAERRAASWQAVREGLAFVAEPVVLCCMARHVRVVSAGRRRCSRCSRRRSSGVDWIRILARPRGGALSGCASRDARPIERGGRALLAAVCVYGSRPWYRPSRGCPLGGGYIVVAWRPGAVVIRRRGAALHPDALRGASRR